MVPPSPGSPLYLDVRLYLCRMMCVLRRPLTIEVRPVASGSATPAASTQMNAADADRPLLRVRDLDVSYAGAVRALRGVSVDVPPNCVVAVLGGNGAGKSTLLRAISGTLRFVGGSIGRGSVELDGRGLDRADPVAIVRAGVVQVPEGRQVFA